MQGQENISSSGRDLKSLDVPIHPLVGMDHMDNAPENKKGLRISSCIDPSSGLCLWEMAQSDENEQGSIYAPLTDP
jgi:hypothetical protein